MKPMNTTKIIICIFFQLALSGIAYAESVKLRPPSLATLTLPSGWFPLPGANEENGISYIAARKNPSGSFAINVEPSTNALESDFERVLEARRKEAIRKNIPVLAYQKSFKSIVGNIETLQSIAESGKYKAKLIQVPYKEETIYITVIYFDPQHRNMIDVELNEIIKNIRGVSPWVAGISPLPITPGSNRERLLELTKLKKEGLISEEEFMEKKREILDEL